MVHCCSACKAQIPLRQLCDKVVHFAADTNHKVCDINHVADFHDLCGGLL